jgi:hypothetical protein
MSATATYEYTEIARYSIRINADAEAPQLLLTPGTPYYQNAAGEIIFSLDADDGQGSGIKSFEFSGVTAGDGSDASSLCSFSNIERGRMLSATGHMAYPGKDGIIHVESMVVTDYIENQVHSAPLDFIFDATPPSVFAPVIDPENRTVDRSCFG